MKKIAAIIKAFIPNEGQYVEAAKGRLELLNLIHIKVHKLEFLEFLKEELKADSKDNIEKELELLESVHERVHRLWSSEVLKVGLETSGRLKLKQLWKLDSDYPLYPLDDFSSFWANLQKKFWLLSNRKNRENLAFELIKSMSEITKSIENELKERGFTTRELLRDRLLGLHHRCKGKPVQDCLEPPKDEYGFYELHDQLASKTLKKTETERQKRRREINSKTKELLEELSQLSPPLTWEEILFHFIKDEVSERKKLSELFPPLIRRYCLECNKPFTLSKNNPGYFRCPKCSTKMRQRRKRGKKLCKG